MKKKPVSKLTLKKEVINNFEARGTKGGTWQLSCNICEPIDETSPSACVGYCNYSWNQTCGNTCGCVTQTCFYTCGQTRHWGCSVVECIPVEPV
jgi:hypothetical protein